MIELALSSRLVQYNLVDKSITDFSDQALGFQPSIYVRYRSDGICPHAHH